MNAIIDRNTRTHWYHPDGTPCHTVPKATGDGDRPTTVADARKLNLIPSVTNILAIKAKEGLNIWRIEQAILAALTLPRIEGESEDSFAQRVAKDAQEQSEKAAELGTQVHAEIEAFHKTKIYDSQSPFAPYIKEYVQWAQKNIKTIVAVEKVLVNANAGYAGRCDCIAVIDGITTIIDWKTQRVKNGKTVFYKDWAMQLAAYRQCLLEDGATPDVACASILINTTEPDKPQFKFWDEKEISEAYNAFKSCLALWSWEKNYKYNPFDNKNT
jgi:hypothetical protein